MFYLMCAVIEAAKDKVRILLDQHPEKYHNRVKREQSSNEYGKEWNIHAWIYFVAQMAQMKKTSQRRLMSDCLLCRQSAAVQDFAFISPNLISGSCCD